MHGGPFPQKRHPSPRSILTLWSWELKILHIVLEVTFGRIGFRRQWVGQTWLTTTVFLTVYALVVPNIQEDVVRTRLLERMHRVNVIARNVRVAASCLSQN